MRTRLLASVPRIAATLCGVIFAHAGASAPYGYGPPQYLHQAPYYQQPYGQPGAAQPGYGMPPMPNGQPAQGQGTLPYGSGPQTTPGSIPGYNLPTRGPQPGPTGYGQQPAYPQGAPWSRPPGPGGYPGSWQGYPMQQGATATPPSSGYSYGPSYGYGSVPGPSSQASSYPTQPAATNGSAPRLEVTVSKDRPYAHETVICTVRIVSGENLKTVDVETPREDTVVFNVLDGPNTSVRSYGGRHEIVNEFRYALIPLQALEIRLDPLRVSGTQANGVEFSAISPNGITLDVKPPVPNVQPWLPLQHLGLRSEVQNANQKKAGAPVTLLIEQTAVGATGAQLPNPEPQLRSTDFRVYRDKTRTNGELSADGRYLHGSRRDYFTLVPQHGGKLKLPELRIPWWNVNTANLQYASVPIQPLEFDGAPAVLGVLGPTGLAAFFPAGNSAVFWVPVGVIAGLLLGYWLAAWVRRPEHEPKKAGRGSSTLSYIGLIFKALGVPFRPVLRRIASSLKAIGIDLAPAAERISSAGATLVRRVSPIPHLRRGLLAAVYALPRPLRFWFCARALDDKASPDEWSVHLQTVASKHLGLSPQSPLATIADAVTAADPKANEEGLRKLMRQLDGAVYGGESIDMGIWNREFRRLVRPRWGKKQDARSERGLPELNPRPA